MVIQDLDLTGVPYGAPVFYYIAGVVKVSLANNRHFKPQNLIAYYPRLNMTSTRISHLGGTGVNRLKYNQNAQYPVHLSIFTPPGEFP
jgi:hypothetical protein